MTVIYIAAIKRDGETYCFLFDRQNAVEVLRQAGRYASSPDLSFTWHDAAIASQKVREQLAEAEGDDFAWLPRRAR